MRVRCWGDAYLFLQLSDKSHGKDLILVDMTTRETPQAGVELAVRAAPRKKDGSFVDEKSVDDAAHGGE